MQFLNPFFRLLFHIGYFGPFLMGILDSSFLVLPFGNDLMVVGLVARHHQAASWYVLAAACGSTVGALLLAVVARKLGEEGLRRFAGDRSYEKLKSRIGNHAALAIGVAGLAPPPFPFTTVIAAVGAVDYPIWRILAVNFLARATRFTVLALLALHYGRAVLSVAQSEPFRWSMFVFIMVCLVASGIYWPISFAPEGPTPGRLTANLRILLGLWEKAKARAPPNGRARATPVPARAPIFRKLRLFVIFSSVCRSRLFRTRWPAGDIARFSGRNTDSAPHQRHEPEHIAVNSNVPIPRKSATCHSAGRSRGHERAVCGLASTRKRAARWQRGATHTATSKQRRKPGKVGDNRVSGSRKCCPSDKTYGCDCRYG